MHWHESDSWAVLAQETHEVWRMLACGGIVIDDEQVELDDVADRRIRSNDDPPQSKESEMDL